MKFDIDRRGVLTKLAMAPVAGSAIGIAVSQSSQDKGLHPDNPSKYVTPDDSVVQTYAREFEFDPRIQSVGIPEGTEFEYVTDKEQFDKDERWLFPREYLEHGRGDCEDFSLTMVSILRSKEIPAKCVIGEVRGGGLNYDETAGHMVAEAKFDGERFLIDLWPPDKLYTTEEYTESVFDYWNPKQMFDESGGYQNYTEDW